MDNTTPKNRNKKWIIVAAIIIAVICFAIALTAGNDSLKDTFVQYTEEDLMQSVEDNDYRVTVDAYNAVIAGDESKEAEYAPYVLQAIDDIVLSWSTGETDYETANRNLNLLCDVNNQSVSTEAKNELRFIEVESKGDAACKEAEEQFEKGDYYQSLVALKDIDPSYSQYYYIEDFRNDCETILNALISSPTTVEEYADCEEKVALYLAVDNSEVFKTRKAELEAQRDDFYNAAPILGKAREDFDKGKYKAAFGKLESGQKIFPQNQFLKETSDELHNVFVAGIAQEVSASVKNEQYDEALKTIDEATGIYDCDSLNDMRVYVWECKNPLYKAKNNIVDKASALKDRLLSGEVDVEKAKKEAGVYVTKSGKKFMLGDYDSEEITLLSASGEIATSLIGIDMAADVRDLSYDITHWGDEDYFALCLATDVVALVPVVGAVKYLKYSDEAAKGARKGAKAARHFLGGTTTATKKINRIIDNSTRITKNGEQTATVTVTILRHLDRVKLALKAAKIKKGFKYTTKDDVATYIRKYKALPRNYITKAEAKAKGIPTGENPSKYYSKKTCYGGDEYYNEIHPTNSGKLPIGKKYYECDVDYPKGDNTRGTRRIVYAEDYSAAYYTEDHYNTFVQLF